MSDAKKDFSVTFEDISGGTEEPTTVDKAVVELTPEEKPAAEAAEEKKEETKKTTQVYIPVPTSDDGSTWEIKSLEDITGAEFIKWANNLCAYPEHLLPPAAQLDKLANKKRYFANIVTLFKDSLVAQYKHRGIDLLDIRN